MRASTTFDDAVAPAASSHLRALLDRLSAGLLTFDRDLTLNFTGAALAVTLGIEPRDAQRATTLPGMFALPGALDDAATQTVLTVCREIIARPGEHSSTLAVRAEPGTRFFAFTVRPLGDGTWLAMFEEVTERRVAEASARDLAMRDPLTGLPNRTLLAQRAVAALDPVALCQTGSGPALLLIDLDRFKTVNDTLGHPVGDALLRLVAKRLRATVRPEDVVARLGGDEFAVLAAPGKTGAALTDLAARIVDMAGRPYLIDGHLVTIGASVGVATAPAHGDDYDHLLRSADLALYAAKQAGRKTSKFFEPAMDVRAHARRTLEFDLRKALAMGEFELHYQPQIDLEQNAIVGFEALLRWRNPGRGLVPPADFIPLAEEIGLIMPLGEWVLREACCEASKWPNGIGVAVNVSPHQFTDTARLVAVVAHALAASGLPGHRLEIEITESVLLRNEAAVITALHDLRAMQVRVAMDDFGTGYSSLSQLHSFPFDKIKIDRSFVTDHADVAGQNAIIRAITALGVSLGMSTIAEGVETADQLARIRGEGCTSVQGYLFSRPVPVGEVAALIADFATNAAT